MYGVIRFLDTPLLPASSPEDYPKIIKSGIDEEGQHPKSPSITGPNGIATLLHRIGRPQLLERLFDIDGTKEYNIRVNMGEGSIQDIYVKRRGSNVEIGYIGNNGEWAQHGVRYRIEKEPAGSQYQIGKWTPLSTSDLNSEWGGSDQWIRGQGAAVAKGIWFHRHFDCPDIEVSWSGMSESDKDDLNAWLKERAVLLEEKERIGKKEYEEHEVQYGEEHYKVAVKESMHAYYKSRMACRADCGEKNPKFSCSKCKMARYCSAACQTDDWKYHKTYCGTEDPIPKEYL